MEDVVLDVYSDGGFEVVGGPYGAIISFNQSSPVPHSQQRGNPVVRVRLSWEMAKVLSFVLPRFVKKTESEKAISYPVSTELLNNLHIAKEDWDLFWASPPDIGGS